MEGKKSKNQPSKKRQDFLLDMLHSIPSSYVQQPMKHLTGTFLVSLNNLPLVPPFPLS